MGGIQDDAAAPARDVEQPAAPEKDVEQPATAETEVAPQAPPDTLVIAPSAASTGRHARVGNDSGARQFASQSVDAPAVSTTVGVAGQQVRSAAVTAAVPVITAAAPAGQTHERSDKPIAAAFTTPSPASNAPETTAASNVLSAAVDLIAGGLASFLDPGPTAPGASPALWAALAWVRRQGAGRFADEKSVAELVQATQIGPLATVAAALVDALPAPWGAGDVGAPGLAGSSSHANGVYTVNGAGADIWADTDQFHFVHQTLNGDGTIIARVTTQENTDIWAKSGVMIKQSATAGADYALLAITPAQGTAFQSGFNQNTQVSASTPPNAWLKLTRVGNTITGFTSADGQNWTQVGTATVNLGTNAEIGLFVTAHDATEVNTSTFDNVSITTSVTPPTSLPAPWVAGDVGAPGLTGSSSYANGVYTVNGAGADIWADTDQFHFVHQTLNGDGTIIARVTTQENTDIWAKSGVMIKQSATAGADYALLAITPAQGTAFQSGFTQNTQVSASTPPNAWLKLTRVGNTITGFTSADGQNWTQVGTATVNLGTNAEIGLFVTAHDATEVNTSTFDNVSITTSVTPPTSLPAPWVAGDVGAPGLTGSSSYANGVYTVNGAGADIWADTDQFHFVHQTLNGNGTIIARVTTQENTDIWAKSGVMIKQSATAGADYALLAITPAQGTAFQSGFTQNTQVSASTPPNAWLKLTRVGNTITGFTSADGQNWTQVGTATVNLGTNAEIGLFVTAHDATEVNTSTFDNVSVSNSVTPPNGGFTPTTVVSGLASPTDFRFLPDGRILVTQKNGTIQVANQNGQLQSQPLITLPTDDTQGRGMWAIAVDPNYSTNGYVYVAYTQAKDAGGNTYERLSRITVANPTAAVLTAAPASEVVLVQGNQPGTADHFGGGLGFGPDGKLYFSTGDNKCCSVIDGSNSQDLRNIYGKVLRLNPDGSVPIDNPFTNPTGELPGRVPPGVDPRIYAYGFRNAFRLTFTPDGRLLVGDVGEGAWEELNLVTAGDDYGWPNAEGPCSPMGTASCGTPPSSTLPIYAYPHDNEHGGNSITGVMVYTGPGSAEGPQHTVLFADFSQGTIQQLTCASDYSSCGSATPFIGAAAGKTVQLAQGPDGNIYQLTFDGRLTRIAPSVVSVL